jgi:hypothetical protein
MCNRKVLLALLAATLTAGNREEVRATGAKGDRLGKPVPIKVDGKPLLPWANPDVFVGDFDGDGRKDLLMGDGYQGRLAIYRNIGTNAAPRLQGPQWFDDKVPTGRIPKG